MKHKVVPKLRFKGFAGFESLKLADVFKNISSGKDKKFENGKYDLYGSTGVIGEALVGSYTGKHILIARVGANAGALNFVDGCFGVSDNTLVLATKSSFSIEYFFYLLNKINISRLVFGSGQPLVTAGHLKKIKVNIPSLPEQQKIADFLSLVDAWIANLKKQKALLESYKKAMMQKIFAREIRFKDEDGNDFPDWEEKRLGDLCKVQNGYAFKSIDFKKTGIPIIRISNISNSNNYLDLANLVYYKKIQNDAQFTLSTGDLLIAMSGATTGKVSIFNLSESAYLNQRVGVFRINDFGLLDYGFLVQFVFSDFFVSQIYSVLVAGAQPNISSKDIELFKIGLPSISEQKKIAKFLLDFDALLDFKDAELSELLIWKKALMQQMFI